MNDRECLRLARLVKAVVPVQTFDEFTTDAWVPLLDDLAYGDCVEAVKRLGRRQRKQPFIAPADIRAEVQIVREERLKHADATFTPSADPQDFEAYQRQLLEHRRAVGDGQEIPEPPRPIAAPPKAQLERVFPHPPRGPAKQTSDPIPLTPRRPISEESRRRAAQLLSEAARAVAEGRNPYAAEETGS